MTLRKTKEGSTSNPDGKGIQPIVTLQKIHKFTLGCITTAYPSIEKSILTKIANQRCTLELSKWYVIHHLKNSIKS